MKDERVKDEKKDLIIVEEHEYNVEPSKVTEFATKAAKQLKDIVTQGKSTIKLADNEYLKFEAWQTVAKFFGSTVSIEWIKPVVLKDKDGNEQIFGYEAKAVVIDSKGRVISSAENGCFKDEPNWVNKPIFQLKSMAQTRASAKALRQVYSWVVVLSGYQATPAEEMDDVQEKHVNNYQSSKTSGVVGAIPKTDAEMVCQKCGDELSDKVFNYSKQKFGKPFCFNCQEKVKAELVSVPKEFVKNPQPVKKVDVSDDDDHI